MIETTAGQGKSAGRKSARKRTSAPALWGALALGRMFGLTELGENPAHEDRQVAKRFRIIRDPKAPLRPLGAMYDPYARRQRQRAQTRRANHRKWGRYRRGVEYGMGAISGLIPTRRRRR